MNSVPENQEVRTPTRSIPGPGRQTPFLAVFSP